jgi:hypothetical protein
MSPFWPTDQADPIIDPLRRSWDDWGPDMQKATLKKTIGRRLYWYLSWLEFKGKILKLWGEK